MSSKQQDSEQEAFKSECWEAVMLENLLPDTAPWRTKDLNGDTLAHLYAKYGVLPDSFSEWKLCSRRTGKTVAEVAMENDTLPENFVRYDLFPVLFPGKSLTDVKEAFAIIPTLKTQLQTATSNYEILRHSCLKSQLIRDDYEKTRQSLSERVQVSVQKSSEALAAKREEIKESVPFSHDLSLIEISIYGSIILASLAIKYFMLTKSIR